MRFDRGLRNATLRPYPSGYLATPTDDFNGEKAQCQFGGIKDSGVWLIEKALPVSIELQVRLTPIWIDNETACAKLDNDAVCFLYRPMSIFSKVTIEAVGAGSYQKASGEEKIPFMGAHFLDYHLIFPEPFLYQKNFLMQSEGCVIHQHSSEMTLGEAPRLWAYGAQQMGEDIHPFVFTLESVRNETYLQPSSLLFWRERGIHPHGEGAAIFQDIFQEDQTRTLFESIEAGMSVIHLGVGVDERGESLKIPYRSYQISKNFISYKREV